MSFDYKNTAPGLWPVAEEIPGFGEIRIRSLEQVGNRSELEKVIQGAIFEVLALHGDLFKPLEEDEEVPVPTEAEQLQAVVDRIRETDQELRNVAGVIKKRLNDWARHPDDQVLVAKYVFGEVDDEALQSNPSLLIAAKDIANIIQSLAGQKEMQDQLCELSGLSALIRRA